MLVVSLRKHMKRSLILFTSLTFAVWSYCFALSQGPLSPSSGVSVPRAGSNAPWMTPGNVTVSDNAYAECSVDPGTNVSEYLEATGFGFSISGTATIDGITVEIEKGSLLSVTDEIVTLISSGSNIGTNHALASTWPTSFTYVSYGGCSDLWGATLTPAIVNSPTFGIRLAYTKTICPACVSYNPDVDHIRITICYSASLPVELLDFKATAEPSGNRINITWNTASETNSDYFLLEKSYDGALFETIAEIKAEGNSTAGQHYSFTDIYPLSRWREEGGEVCYRLRQFDYNGNFILSPVTMAKVHIAGSGFCVFPNPVPLNNPVIIQLPENFRGEKLSVVLHDLSGRKIPCPGMPASHGGLILYPAAEPGIYPYIITIDGYPVQEGKLMVK